MSNSDMWPEVTPQPVKKYKLSKDMLAGTEVPESFFKTFPSLVEEIKEPTRWRRGKGGHYWFVDLSLEADESTETLGGQSQRLWELGNYFQTKEQAQAAADAIKKLLEYIHTPVENVNEHGAPEPSSRYEKNFIGAADTARKIVQGVE